MRAVVTVKPAWVTMVDMTDQRQMGRAGGAIYGDSELAAPADIYSSDKVFIVEEVLIHHHLRTFDCSIQPKKRYTLSVLKYGS